MSAFHFSHPIAVRYNDLDPQGHVNNAAYLTYLEQARIHYLMHLNLYQRGRSFLDIGIIVATAQITYKQPIHFWQEVIVETAVTRLGTKSLTMVYRLAEPQTQSEFASAETVLVTYDYHRAQTIPIPARWREAINAFENLPDTLSSKGKDHD